MTAHRGDLWRGANCHCATADTAPADQSMASTGVRASAATIVLTSNRISPPVMPQACMPVIDALAVRGSRCGQRPLSTSARKSLTMRLNSPGASRLMAWPQFGITAKAAAGMFCFIKTPGIRQGQSSSPVRMSVGTANDVRALEAQMIEHRSDVGGGAPLGIGDLACRHIRRRITSGVECDAAVAPAEMSHLPLPAAMIPGEFVHEDQRRAGTGLLIVKANSVVGHGKWHG